MYLKISLLIALFCTSFFSLAIADNEDSRTVLPAKISKDEAAGMIFQRDSMRATTHPDGHQTESVTSMSSSDGKFSSGMYRSGKTRIEISEPYGVDEFMYFLRGGVTLTSSDGSVMTVSAGEGVTMPKEWTGIWDTDGYEKIWVIYSSEE
jgi:uncharacterized cupin superfamily protein